MYYVSSNLFFYAQQMYYEQLWSIYHSKKTLKDELLW